MLKNIFFLMIKLNFKSWNNIRKRRHMDNNSQDCLGCRIISGTGLLGAATYIGFEARKNNNKWGKIAMSCIGLGMACIASDTKVILIIFHLGFGAVGLARLLNIYPFNVTHKSITGHEK